ELPMICWGFRLLSEHGKLGADNIRRLADIAGSEKSPEIRLELASAALRLGKSQDVTLLVHELMKRKEDGSDAVIPQLVWLAYEALVSRHTKVKLVCLRENPPANALIADFIIPRAMRRLVATDKQEDLALCMKFVGDLKDNALRRQALFGLAI